jgi:HEPN domain-containing protein
LPQADRSETARVLRKKGNEDAAVVWELLDNSRIADSIIGFYTQQEVEKWLKAVAAATGVTYGRTHDIDRLLEILEAAGIELPPDRDRLSVLTQYAVPLRYDELLDAEFVDREVLELMLGQVAQWVDVQLPVAD